MVRDSHVRTEVDIRIVLLKTKEFGVLPAEGLEDKKHLPLGGEGAEGT